MENRTPVGKQKKKETYKKPSLKRYGSLRELTGAKGGNRSDGGLPKTRTTTGV